MLKSNASTTKLFERTISGNVCLLSSDRVIVDAIKVAQDLVRQNLPQTHNLTDAATVMQFRELVRSQATRSALERSNDTVERVFAINRALIAFGVCAAMAGDHYSALGQRCAGIGDAQHAAPFCQARGCSLQRRCCSCQRQYRYRNSSRGSKDGVSRLRRRLASPSPFLQTARRTEAERRRAKNSREITDRGTIRLPVSFTRFCERTA
jgi:hypothetical protein